MAMEEWKNKLQGAHDSGQTAFDQQTDTMISKHLPQVQSLFKEKVGPTALAAAQDDHKMELLFKAVYSALPFPVRLAVKEVSFVKFCFAHRNQLLPSGEAKSEAANL